MQGHFESLMAKLPFRNLGFNSDSLTSRVIFFIFLTTGITSIFIIYFCFCGSTVIVLVFLDGSLMQLVF